MIIIKNDEEVMGIRTSADMVAYVLSRLMKEVKPGITTNYLNALAEELTFDKGALPGFKGYRGFPYSICASVNDAVVHGFPSDRELQDGDILSVDFGILYKGWYGDSAFTVAVGNISDRNRQLMLVTEKCLYLGIQQAYPGNRVGDISYAVQQCAEREGFNVVKEFSGHGIGKDLHEEPAINNFGNKGEGYLLKSGMTIAIEPMLVDGSAEVVIDNNGWEVLTKYGGMAAHFEHTLAITENGPIILSDRSRFN